MNNIPAAHCWSPEDFWNFLIFIRVYIFPLKEYLNHDFSNDSWLCVYYRITDVLGRERVIIEFALCLFQIERNIRLFIWNILWPPWTFCWHLISPIISNYEPVISRPDLLLIKIGIKPICRPYEQAYRWPIHGNSSLYIICNMRDTCFVFTLFSHCTSL